MRWKRIAIYGKEQGEWDRLAKDIDSDDEHIPLRIPVFDDDGMCGPLYVGTLMERDRSSAIRADLKVRMELSITDDAPIPKLQENFPDSYIWARDMSRMDWDSPLHEFDTTHLIVAKKMDHFDKNPLLPDELKD